MPLIFADENKPLTIVKVNGSEKQRIIDMGFNIGEKVTIISKVASGIMVKVKEAHIGIDYVVASKIIVK